MKICRVVWEFPRSSEIKYGVGPNFYFISQEQARLGHDVHIVARRNPGEPSEETSGEVNVHRVGTPFSLNATRKLAELVRSERIEIAHTHGTAALGGMLIKEVLGIPFVVHLHQSIKGFRQFSRERLAGLSFRSQLRSKIRQKIWETRLRVVLGRADAIIAVSKSAARDLQTSGLADIGRVSVVYNGVDTSMFTLDSNRDSLRRSLGIENSKAVLYVGHFGTRKGIQVLLQAISEVRSKVPEVTLLCVGGVPKWLGTMEYQKILEARVSQLGLKDNVRFIPPIPHHELPSTYSIADVFVLPSFYEALGKVLLEAMACSVPVVATRVGGVPELIEDGTNGILVEPGNPCELAKAILTILKDKELSARFSKNGRKLVESRFTWAQTAKNIDEVYLSILRR